MYPSIIPMLTYENGISAMEWLCRVFGFTEKTRWLDDHGRLSHGEITVGTGMVMLANGSDAYQGPRNHRLGCARAASWYEVPYVINGVLVYVEDVQKHFQHAVDQGATILSPLEYGAPGTRYRAEDPEGQRWMFLQAE
jgi:uncharacterized glyoxalase superfamily protein PhnB